MRKWLVPIFAGFLLGIPSAWSDTVFTDSTFNLRGYSISTHQSGGATINISQTLTGGNPGSALQVLTTVPAPVGLSYAGTSYIINKTFAYNPSSRGTVRSIDVSIDVYRLFTGQNPSLVGFSPLVLQGGNYYVFHSIITPYTPAAYEPTSGTVVVAQFSLVTNLTTGAVDSSMHPNFGGGPLEFGFTSSLNSSGIPQTVTADFRYDNLSFDLKTTTVTPEPDSRVLLGLSLIALVVIYRKRLFA